MACMQEVSYLNKNYSMNTYAMRDSRRLHPRGNRGSMVEVSVDQWGGGVIGVY